MPPCLPKVKPGCKPLPAGPRARYKTGWVRLLPVLTDICLNDMFLCMRTTLSLDDNLMRAAKRRAAETGQTLSSVIETALRETLEQEKKTKHSFRLRWITVKGRVQPGVDLVDRDALIDRMEGRS
jgi:hypothetical protein